MVSNLFPPSPKFEMLEEAHMWLLYAVWGLIWIAITMWEIANNIDPTLSTIIAVGGVLIGLLVEILISLSE
jgi:hypothetical protein